MNNTDKAEESCGIERMPKAYGVKQLSSMNFEYPIPYEKLKICHPTQKVRLLEKRDIVISSLNSDGKIRVYLVNKELKEDITVGGSCYIVKSQKVCPEYLYLYLQSETADKYIFYNSPFIQVTPSTINKILVLIPSDRMQELARLTFQAGHNTSQPIQINRIMTNGSTWNQSDSAIRSYFIENGLIECVIALPARLFAGTAIATSMIVFSRNNKGVRLVDASELFVEGRRVNELSYENISLIINATKNDSDISMYVSAEQLRDNDYVLSMNRYIVHDVADGMAFGDVIKRITRGAQLNAKALDEITTTVPTDMQYLMLANIKNGLIDKELPYLKSIDKKNDKYCLSNHCLILSKNGYPYKIAVAEVKEGQRILGNGNLYIIELDEEKADPYYLAAFFGSEQGTAALRSITVGATIPNIGVEQLTKLVIPIPPIEKQKEIADKYKTVKDEITMLQLKLEKAKNRMAHIIEEGGANNA